MIRWKREMPVPLAEPHPIARVEQAPEYLAIEINFLTGKSNWIRGELDLWRERLEEAQKAIQQLEQIDVQNSASLRQLDPPQSPDTSCQTPDASTYDLSTDDLGEILETDLATELKNV